MASFSTGSFYGRGLRNPNQPGDTQEIVDESDVTDHDSDLSDVEGSISELLHDTNTETEGESEPDDYDDRDTDENFFTAKSGRKWEKVPPRGRRTAAVNIVTEREGVNPEFLPLIDCVRDSIGLFITQNMIQDITIHTNQEINRRNAVPGQEVEIDHKYTDEVEMEALLGLLLAIGASRGRSESLTDLWQDGPFSRPFFRAVMDRKRLQWLLSCLRFDNKDDREVRKQMDKLAPISDIWNEFVENCKIAYRPGPICTIDEHMVSFRGRCSFIMYLPSKPDKYGIKVFTMVCSHCYYVVNANIYTGKEPGAPPTRDLASKVVQQLVEPIKNSCGNVTFDNWFTSVALAELLLEQKLTCVVTLKKN